MNPVPISKEIDALLNKVLSQGHRTYLDDLFLSCEMSLRGRCGLLMNLEQVQWFDHVLRKCG